jgi:hypothetical protein
VNEKRSVHSTKQMLAKKKKKKITRDVPGKLAMTYDIKFKSIYITLGGKKI